MSEPKNLRNYHPSMSTGKDAKASGGPLDGQAIRFTKAEKEENVTEEAYSRSCPKDNLGGKDTGS